MMEHDKNSCRVGAADEDLCPEDALFRSPYDEKIKNSKLSSYARERYGPQNRDAKNTTAAAVGGKMGMPAAVKGDNMSDLMEDS